MDKDLTVVSIIHIAFGGLGVLGASIVFLVVAGGGLVSGDEHAMLITTSVATIIVFVIMLFSLPELLAGIFLLQRKEWARIVALVLSVISLINIPLGTAAGIYTLWVLLNDETRALFRHAPGA